MGKRCSPLVNEAAFSLGGILGVFSRIRTGSDAFCFASYVFGVGGGEFISGEPWGFHGGHCHVQGGESGLRRLLPDQRG